MTDAAFTPVKSNAGPPQQPQLADTHVHSEAHNSSA